MDIKSLSREGCAGTVGRMKGVGAILILLGLLASAPAVAGTVYRCDTGDGVRSYASKRITGASCVAVSSFRVSRTRGFTSSFATPPVEVASIPPAAMGTMTTAYPVAGSPTLTSAPQSSIGPKQPKFLRMGMSTTYSYVDASGVRNFSNLRPRGVANVNVSHLRYPIFQMETCYACALQPTVNFASTRLNSTAYQVEISQASHDFGVDEAIIRAIIHAESAFRPTALSRVGAQGLMQLMPATARRFGVGNPFDAGQNIRGGVQYLAFLLRRFNGDLKLAAAGYNAGEGAVDKYRGVPPYSETKRYVQRVGMLADRYRGGFASR
jgi:hypothetical protein